MRMKLKKNSKKQKVKRSKKRKTSILKIKKATKKKGEHARVSGLRSRITGDMTIVQVMRARPDAVEKLLNMGMGCGGCQFAMMETIEQGAMVHGLDVDRVLKELNSD